MSPLMGDTPRTRFNPSSLVGWVTGGLSLLHLVRDFTPLELYGLARDWVEAYSLLAARVTGFLFGWLQWRWFAVGANEGHVLVLTGLFATAYVRATTGRESASRDDRSRLVATVSAILTGLMILVPALIAAVLLPDPYGVLVGGSTTALVVWIMGFAEGGAKEDYETLPTPREVQFEVKGVVVVFLLVVILNYTLFRPG